MIYLLSMMELAILKQTIIYKGLIILSIFTGGFLLSRIGLPAGWFIGPMILSAIFSIKGYFAFTQKPYITSVCLIFFGLALSRSFSDETLTIFNKNCILIICVVALILTVSVICALLMNRVFKLDPSTSYLGILPGGASVMVALSNQFHGNSPLVAVIQYTRISIVILISALIGLVLKKMGYGNEMQDIINTAVSQYNLYDYIATLLLFIFAFILSNLIVFPANTLIISITLGVIFTRMSLGNLTLPSLLFPIIYGLLGMQTGAQFTRESMIQIRSSLFLIFLIILCLVILCAAIGYVVHLITGIPVLTAYLATTPGGINAMMIIAVDLGLNGPLIMTIQIFRLFSIIIFSPLIAKFILIRR